MAVPLFTSILVAINGSDASILAAKYAIVLAKNCRAKLSAVYVVDTATISHLTVNKIMIHEESLEYERSLEAIGDRYLCFIEELALAKGVKIEREIRQGDVKTEILMAANEKKADMIILGGWENEKNPRDIITLSYRDIILNAKCSVLLAKEPDIDNLYKRA